jgi:protein-tyrosine phosphatase
MSIKKIGVLFVCLGNICRSPAAEGAFSYEVKEKELEEFFSIDSCGTANYHIGEEPHETTREVARARGIILKHRCRQFVVSDFKKFDYIMAMDHSNYQNIIRLAPDEESKSKVHLFREFDPSVSGKTPPDVPDPYYGGIGGFEHVQDIVSRCSVALVDLIIRERNLKEFQKDNFVPAVEIGDEDDI